MRPIDADALIDRLDYCVKEGMGSTIAFTFKHMVEDAPTIDAVSVVHGEWINKHEWGNGFLERECSLCGAMKPILMHTAKINYCPNCGAKMDGEAKESE